MAYEVVVYGRPDRVCMKCRATKQWLRRHGIEYRAVNIDQDPEADAHVRELGALAVPVVEWSAVGASGVWWDHRVNKLNELADAIAGDGEEG